MRLPLRFKDAFRQLPIVGHFRCFRQVEASYFIVGSAVFGVQDVAYFLRFFFEAAANALCINRKGFAATCGKYKMIFHFVMMCLNVRKDRRYWPIDAGRKSR